jgi:hypothetical protein
MMNWPGGGDQHFGNLMGKKADDVCRLAFLNVDTFPYLASNPKIGTARATFKKWQIDVWGWVEINVNWLLAKQSDKLEYRSKEWFENKAVIIALLGIRVLFWKLACNKAHGAKFQ